MITGEGFPKDNAENRIALFNYFLFYVYLIHKNKQRVMSSPTSEVLPPLEIQQKAVRGKHPRDPRMLQGCVIPPLSVPRPPGHPPVRPRPQRRMLTEAWVWSPPRPAADSRQGPDLGSPPCLPPAAPPQPPTIPAGSVYKPLLAVPLSNASPRQTGSQTRTHRVPGREDRPLLREERAAGRGLTSLSHCFLRRLYHPIRPLPVPPNGEEPTRVSYQQLPLLRESQKKMLSKSRNELLFVSS